jgi:hypothetical protein
MSACRCLTQQPLPHEGHCCLKDGWNPAADQLPDMHPDRTVFEGDIRRSRTASVVIGTASSEVLRHDLIDSDGVRRFVRRYFIEAQGMDPDDEVTRIEWRYLDGGE